jgi:hypothetical protein
MIGMINARDPYHLFIFRFLILRLRTRFPAQVSRKSRLWTSTRSRFRRGRVISVLRSRVRILVVCNCGLRGVQYSLFFLMMLCACLDVDVDSESPCSPSDGDVDRVAYVYWWDMEV